VQLALERVRLTLADRLADLRVCGEVRRMAVLLDGRGDLLTLLAVDVLSLWRHSGGFGTERSVSIDIDLVTKTVALNALGEASPLLRNPSTRSATLADQVHDVRRRVDQG
jgi:hypothetical protein